MTQNLPIKTLTKNKFKIIGIFKKSNYLFKRKYRALVKFKYLNRMKMKMDKCFKIKDQAPKSDRFKNKKSARMN